MDISRIHNASSTALQQARTEESNEAREARKQAPSKARVAGGESDAIELQSKASESPIMMAARTALGQVDTLGDARRLEIREKIQNGFYSQPETIEKVAGAMANALTNKDRE
ncbi:MAG: anti-sigma28 factor (negative regulator of flagellin synthesis) [Rhodothermales bacterium]|jgi:anti-sigma28 factor (negative regulator of flagellin synthesis)